jgi:hypothetical protein
MLRGLTSKDVLQVVNMKNNRPKSPDSRQSSTQLRMIHRAGKECHEGSMGRVNGSAIAGKRKQKRHPKMPNLRLTNGSLIKQSVSAKTQMCGLFSKSISLSNPIHLVNRRSLLCSRACLRHQIKPDPKPDSSHPRALSWSHYWHLAVLSL